MYKLDELKLLDKNVLIDIILNQDSRLQMTHKGQPRRDNLVGQSFGALTVVGDAGNAQGHSVWHCRCSGDLNNPEVTGVCDRLTTAWGSNLKAERQQYCGVPECPAARQMLAKKRRGDLVLDGGLNRFIIKQLKFKYALLGEETSAELTLRDYNYLTGVLQQYYGIPSACQDAHLLGEALKIEEIAGKFGMKPIQVSNIKKGLDEYIERYQQAIAVETEAIQETLRDESN